MSSIVRRVVLVAIEGLRPESIESFSLFNTKRFIEQGASALQAKSVNPDFAFARLASLLTGISPARHGALGERPGFLRTRGRVEPLAAVIANEGFQVSAFLPEVPPSLAGRAGLTGRELGFTHLSLRGSTSSDVVSSAINALCAQRRGLIAVHLPDVARVIRAGGTTTEYAQAAQRADQSLGILASLSGASSGESLLVIVSDGGDSDGQPQIAPDRAVSVILFGKCIAARTLHDMSLLDIPPTILWSLGLPVPFSYEGRVCAEAFESAPVALRAFA